MGDGFKGFFTGFGATIGIILGLYAGFKGIELIGYAQAKRELEREKDFEHKLEEARHSGAHPEAVTAPAAPETPAEPAVA